MFKQTRKLLYKFDQNNTRKPSKHYLYKYLNQQAKLPKIALEISVNNTYGNIASINLAGESTKVYTPQFSKHYL